MTINERIKQIRKEANLKQRPFAERTGLSVDGISQIERGVSNPSPTTIELICREFNVNREWLETGEGDMYKTMTRYGYIANLTAALMKEKPDSFKNRFIKALSEISEDDWKSIENFAKKLSEP